MSKLTLSVDDRVISRAKRYARQHGVSISKMVETYLSAVVEPHATDRDTPILRAVRGSLRRGAIADYKKHLVAKYR